AGRVGVVAPLGEHGHERRRRVPRGQQRGGLGLQADPAQHLQGAAGLAPGGIDHGYPAFPSLPLGSRSRPVEPAWLATPGMPVGRVAGSTSEPAGTISPASGSCRTSSSSISPALPPLEPAGMWLVPDAPLLFTLLHLLCHPPPHGGDRVVQV